MADPAGLYDRVLVGDVGEVEHGDFFRIFNALLPANDIAQVYGVPDGFVPLSMAHKIYSKGTTAQILCLWIMEMGVRLGTWRVTIQRNHIFIRWMASAVQKKARVLLFKC